MKFKDYDYFDDTEYLTKKKPKRVNQIVITEDMVNNLMNSKIDNRVIFGYIRKDIQGNFEICKYNKQIELFISYNKNEVLSKRIKLWREYTGDKVVEYYDEVYE